MICYSCKEQNSKQTLDSFDLTIYCYEQTMQKQQALHFSNLMFDQFRKIERT